MALGYPPEFEEDDVAGPLPMASPEIAAPGIIDPGAQAMPPDPTVMSPLGQVPASAIPADQQPQDMAPVTPEAPQLPGAGAAGAVAPDQPPAAAAGPPVLPRPTRPPLTGDPSKDIDNSLKYERDLEDWHAGQLAAATGAQSDIRAEQAKKELAVRQEAEQRRLAEEKAREADLAEQRRSISDATTARAHAIGDLESGKWKEQSTGTKIASVIAMTLGTIGAGFSAAGGHPTGNLAAQTIDNLLEREHKHAMDRVTNANESVLQARYGYKDAAENHRAAQNDIDADMAAKYKLVADEAAAQMQARGASPEQIHNNDLVAASLQKSAQYEDQIHAREIEAQRKAQDEARKKELDASTIKRNNAQADAAEALAGFRNRRGAGTGKGGAAGSGGGAVDAMAAAADAGGSVAAVTKAGVHAGMKPKDAAAQAKAYVEDYEKRNGIGGKGAKGPGGVDPNMVVRDTSGKPIGMTSSSRDVPKARAFVINYDQAIRSLRDILASGDTIPRGSKFDNAVLAIASTTTAGATDANVRHEAGTLKDKLGLLDANAISAKIKDLEERRDQFRRTLTPLPPGYKEANAAPAKTQQIGKVTYEWNEEAGHWQKQKADGGDIKL